MGRASRKKRTRHSVTHFDMNPAPYEIWASPEQAIHIRQKYDGRKISEALGELIEPYIVDDMSLDEMRTLATLGVIAWNLALLEEPEISEAFDDAQQALEAIDPSSEDAWIVEALLEDMVDRKLQLFPKDMRFIEDFEVTREGRRRFHIKVAATAPAGDIAPNTANTGNEYRP